MEWEPACRTSRLFSACQGAHRKKKKEKKKKKRKEKERIGAAEAPSPATLVTLSGHGNLDS
jgi:hypothetical protein